MKPVFETRESNWGGGTSFTPFVPSCFAATLLTGSFVAGGKQPADWPVETPNVTGIQRACARARALVCDELMVLH